MSDNEPVPVEEKKSGDAIPIGDSPISLGSVIDNSVNQAVDSVSETVEEAVAPVKGVKRHGAMSSNHSLKAKQKNQKKKAEKKARRKQRK